MMIGTIETATSAVHLEEGKRQRDHREEHTGVANAVHQVQPRTSVGSESPVEERIFTSQHKRDRPQKNWYRQVHPKQ